MYVQWTPKQTQGNICKTYTWENCVPNTQNALQISKTNTTMEGPAEGVVSHRTDTMADKVLTGSASLTTV